MEKIQLLIKECILKQALKVSLEAGGVPVMYGATKEHIDHEIKDSFSADELMLFLSLFVGEIAQTDKFKKIIDWEIPNFGIIKIVSIKEDNVSLTLYMPLGEELFQKEVDLSCFDLSLTPTCQEYLNKKEEPEESLDSLDSSSTFTTTIVTTTDAVPFPPLPDLSKEQPSLNSDKQEASQNDSKISQHDIPVPPKMNKAPSFIPTTSPTPEEKQDKSSEEKPSKNQEDLLDIDLNFTPPPKPPVVPTAEESSSKDLQTPSSENMGLDIDLNLGSNSSQEPVEDNNSTSDQEPTTNQEEVSSDLSKEIMDFSSVLNSSYDSSSKPQETPESESEPEPVTPSIDVNMDDLFSNGTNESSSSKVKEEKPVTKKKNETEKNNETSDKASNVLNLDSLFHSNKQEEPDQNKITSNLHDIPVPGMNVDSNSVSDSISDMSKSLSSNIPSKSDYISEILSHLDKYQIAYLYPDSIVSYKNDKGFEKIGSTLSFDKYETLIRKLRPIDESFNIYSYSNSYYLKTDLPSGIALSKLKTGFTPSTTFDPNLLSSFLTYSSGIVFSRGEYKDISAKDIFINYINENYSKYILDFESSPSFYHRNQTSLIELKKYDTDIEKLISQINLKVVDVCCFDVTLLDEKTLFSLLKLASTNLVLAHTNYPSKTKLLTQIKVIIEGATYLEDDFSSEFLGVVSLGAKNEIDCVKQTKPKAKKVVS